MRKILLILCAFFLGAVFCPSESVSSPVEEAWIAVGSDQADDALKILEHYTPQKNELLSYYYVYARAFDNVGKYRDSLEYYRLALSHAQKTEDREKILFDRAETLFRMRNFQESAVAFKLFLQKFPRSDRADEALQAVGDAYFRGGEYKNALASYEKAGKSYAAMYGKANTLHAMGKFREAHEIYQSLEDKGKEFLTFPEETILRIGDTMRQIGKTNDAKTYLRMIKDAPYTYHAAIIYGQIALEEKNYAEAVKQFEYALQHDDRVVRKVALTGAAEAAFHLDRKKDARAYIDEITKNYFYTKEFDRSLILLSRIFRQEGKTNEAVRVLNPLVFRANPDRKALDELEVIILDAAEKKSDDLVKIWKTVGKRLLDPSRSDSLARIAVALRPVGKPFLDLCLWIRSNGSPSAKDRCNAQLAGFFVDIGDDKTASRYLQDVRGNDDETLRTQSKLHLSRGETGKALFFMQSIRKMNRQDIDFLVGMVNVNDFQPQLIKMIEREANRAQGPSTAFLRIADSYFNAGQLNIALKYYREAIAAMDREKRGESSDREWALYRIVQLTKGKESDDTLSKMSKSDETTGKYLDAEKKERDLAEKMKRNP